MYKKQCEFRWFLSKANECFEEMTDRTLKRYNYIYNKKDRITENMVNAILAELMDLYKQADEYRELFSGMSSEYKDTVLDEVDRLRAENAVLENEKVRYKAEAVELKTEVDRLRAENAILNEKLKNFPTNETILNNMREMFNCVEENTDSIKSMLELVGNNVRQLALQEYIKSDEFKERDRTGEKNPNYRKDINTEEVNKLYRAGLSIKEIAKKYECSYNTIATRVKGGNNYGKKENMDN